MIDSINRRKHLQFWIKNVYFQKYSTVNMNISPRPVQTHEPWFIMFNPLNFDDRQSNGLMHIKVKTKRLNFIG